ncbi:hypothetical protein [Streptosporangium canum]|uniref:hypothetical protein n=1 Tax=Streptosporangium canum TaxID=324952 RepID=UPI00343978CD
MAGVLASDGAAGGGSTIISCAIDLDKPLEREANACLVRLTDWQQVIHRAFWEPPERTIMNGDVR